MATELIRGSVITAAQAAGAVRVGLLVSETRVAAVYFFDEGRREVGCVFPDLGHLTLSGRQRPWSPPSLAALQWQDIGGRRYASDTLYNLRVSPGGLVT